MIAALPQQCYGTIHDVEAKPVPFQKNDLS